MAKEKGELGDRFCGIRRGGLTAAQEIRIRQELDVVESESTNTTTDMGALKKEG